MSVRETLDVIQRIQAKKGIIGADIVEYNPKRDINQVTSMVSAKILKEIADKILQSNSKTKTKEKKKSK